MTSERVDKLDAAAEVFYRRLMSKVDDYGLYDAREAILKSALYPLRTDRVREADIARWKAICQKAGLIVLYAHDGKPYLQMLDTKWQSRSEAKYPFPPGTGQAHDKNGDSRGVANSCQQLFATVGLIGTGTGNGTGNGDGNGAGPPGGKDEGKRPKAKVQSPKSSGDGPGDAARATARPGDNGHERDGHTPLVTRRSSRALSGAEIIKHERELERVSARIAEIRNGCESHRELGEKERAELKRLKERAAELREVLQVLI